MIHLLMSDGSYREVPEAKDAVVEGDSLLLYNAAGAVIETVSCSMVSAFGDLEGYLATVVGEASPLAQVA
jgi:hypothetical protein